MTANGLEEHVGGGIGMALRVEAARDRLTFTSDHYFVGMGRVRFRLPRWCSPGVTKVTHRDREAASRSMFDMICERLRITCRLP
ncbi:MAG: DUF4166 domain-containing protein [Sphingomonadales bacterium]|nr:DUF4166 domain-containing protein [Sphingomonadales bacterium]